MEMWRFFGLILLISVFDGALSNSDPFEYNGDQSDAQHQAPGEPFSPLDFSNAEKITNFSSSVDKNTNDPIEIAGLYEGDILIPSSGRNAIKEDLQKWKDGIVPYLISAEFDERERSVIARAILEYHRRTCVVLRPRTNEPDYVHFSKGQGCSSQIGRVGGAQRITLGQGCVNYPGIAIHEIMHAIGFWHEQSRWDRDDYITVYIDNIKKGMEFNFQKYSWTTIQNLSTFYDTGSIMHYGAYAFSKDSNLPTILPKNPNKKIGQREMFSENDVVKINKLYKCKSKNNEEEKPGSNNSITTPPPASIAPDSKCADQHQNCKRWKEMGECTNNPSWMRLNCKHSCNTCDNPCSDSNKDCVVWAKNGECNKNPGYMHSYCAESCQKCKKEHTAENATNLKCQDNDKGCSAWAARGECERNPVYMKTNCSKSCNTCPKD